MILSGMVSVLLLFVIFALPAMSVKQVAIVVGCNDYENVPLIASVINAENVSKVLKEAGYEVWTMTDKALDAKGDYHPEKLFPTKTNLERQVSIWAPEKSYGKGDLILFYFSGHGVRIEGIDYLVPLRFGEGKPDHLVSLPYIYEQLRRSGAQNIIVMTDACRYVPGEKGLSKRDRDVEFGKSGNALGTVSTEAQCYAFLRNCPEGCKFPEEDDGKMSYISQAIVEGLRGKADDTGAGVITIRNLYKYVLNWFKSHFKNRSRIPTLQYGGEGSGTDAIVLRDFRKDQSPQPAPK